MPNYLYQIPSAEAGGEPVYYQISQEAGEAPLAVHPHTAEVWERVLNDDGTPVILPESGGCGCGEKGCC